MFLREADAENRVFFAFGQVSRKEEGAESRTFFVLRKLCGAEERAESCTLSVLGKRCGTVSGSHEFLVACYRYKNSLGFDRQVEIVRSSASSGPK